MLGGFGQMADECWRGWVRVARELLGPPDGLERAEDFAEAAARGELYWDLDRRGESAAPEQHDHARINGGNGDGGTGGGDGIVAAAPGEFAIIGSRAWFETVVSPTAR